MGRGLSPMNYFIFWDPPPNISGTADDTNLKFCTWNKGKVPDTEQKMQNWS